MNAVGAAAEAANHHPDIDIRYNKVRLALTTHDSGGITLLDLALADQAIRRLKRDKPGMRIIVTGCAAQTEPETFAAMAEVDAVLGNREKLTSQAYADFGTGRHGAHPRQ